MEMTAWCMKRNDEVGRQGRGDPSSLGMGDGWLVVVGCRQQRPMFEIVRLPSKLRLLDMNACVSRAGVKMEGRGVIARRSILSGTASISWSTCVCSMMI